METADPSTEIAAVTRIALDAVLLDPERRREFRKQFVLAAGDSMARPARVEDEEHFIDGAVDRLLADSELRDTLRLLVRSGLTSYAAWTDLK